VQKHTRRLKVSTHWTKSEQTERSAGAIQHILCLVDEQQGLSMASQKPLGHLNAPQPLSGVGGATLAIVFTESVQFGIQPGCQRSR
jgi:hypothetical protein